MLLHCFNILCLCLQLVDKLNTNTEMEEMINDYNAVSTPPRRHANDVLERIHKAKRLFLVFTPNESSVPSFGLPPSLPPRSKPTMTARPKASTASSLRGGSKYSGR